ncbi:MAG: SGNH/GDSL hydrolase family protein [Dactylosporangium sp.]|nr:SGNH/GDSL hydrolase family protein [Dactylosporangium sp.]NNJ61605.1 SGNH/GDSL hydrolase family protein [Dactylosporangium sp.]
MTTRSFVAIGDSFTEGLDDPYPDGASFCGWADLVARSLATEASAAGGGPLHYANLAIRGRLFTQVVDEQVPIGLDMGPDLFAFAAGGNDALRRGFDPDRLLERFEHVVVTLRATGADVLLFRFIDLSRRLPGKRVLRRRVEVLNDGVTDVGLRHRARVADLWTDHAFDNPRMWSADRLHLSTTGHRRVAAHALAALGRTPDPTWLAPLAPEKPVPWGAARRADVRWARDHLGPWLGRRLSGRSSGDTRTAKRPVLAPMD